MKKLILHHKKTIAFIENMNEGDLQMEFYKAVLQFNFIFLQIMKYTYSLEFTKANSLNKKIGELYNCHCHGLESMLMPDADSAISGSVFNCS